MKNLLLILCLLTTTSAISTAQVNLWKSADEAEIINRNQGERYTNPVDFGLYRLQLEDLRSALASAPHERQISSRNSYAKFSFPMPDGSFRTFNLVEYEMMDAKLMRKFPLLKAYTGVDLEHGSKIHLNLTDDQFFAVIREKGHSYYIDPYYKEASEFYVSYDIKAIINAGGRISCGTLGPDADDMLNALGDPGSSSDLFNKRGDAFTLKTYRLAVTGTAGFTAFHGGTVADGLAAIVTIVNRINSVFEREVAIRLILVANNDQLIFTDAATEPFANVVNGDQAGMMSQNQITVTSIIGSNNFDIGHVFNIKANSPPSGQGIASRGSVCSNMFKASGSSGSTNPVGAFFTVAIICHEMGHQFNANHTMYHCQNVNISTSYEPGSGSTIMSYAGICSPIADIQNAADDYYHNNSVSTIISYSRVGGGSCGQDIDFGNTYPDPMLDYPNLTYIPVNTPIYLEGTAADAETPNSLTYCWEQYNNGYRDYENSPWDISKPTLNEPLFRSRPPVPESYRYFPALPVVVNSSNYLFEQYATYARDLTFRMTVRDNASENGGTVWEEVKLKVIDNSAAGEFQFTNFLVKDTIKSGDYVEVTWNVADTDLPPISCEQVNIRLSIDGGTSFPYLLKEGTPNDGSAFVNIPNETADRFRFMIEATDNVFYNATRRSGLLCVDSMKAAVGLTYNDEYFRVCLPASVAVDINTFGLGGFDGMLDYTIISGLPAGAVGTFSANQAMVGQPNTLTLDLNNVSTGGNYEVTFEVSGTGIETQSRSVEFEVTTNNFDNLTLDAPANGSIGVDLVPTLDWTGVVDADLYTVELSDNIDFLPSPIFSVSNTTATTATVDALLDAGKVYYWRVSPSNSCDARHELNRVSAFQTKALTCEEYCSTAGQILIPAAVPITIEMSIDVGGAKEVDELNITEIKGRHGDMSQLKFSIVNPDDITVTLLNSGSCPYNSNYDMGFDDDAVGVLPDCANFNTFSEGTRFQPIQSLGMLNGSPTGSVYKLIVEDIQAGQGGNLTSWCFELCGAGDIEAASLITADSIQMPIQSTRTVGSNKLEVSHTQYNASELNITILNQPVHGVLSIDGTPVASGAQLTMQDVIDNKLTYQHTNSTADLDQFTFIVTDPGGGFLGTPAIQFFVGAVATYDQLPEGSELTIFPNPTSSALTISLDGFDLVLDDVSIYNIQGQLVSTIKDIKNDHVQLNVEEMAAGFYMLAIKSGKYTVMRKFVKQ